MNRRTVLAGALATVPVAFGQRANAAGQCVPINPWVQQCTVGVSSGLITAEAQPLSQWCWAASISSIFRYHGHVVSQQRIVEQTWGAVVNMPASNDQIIRNLNRTWVDDYGGNFQVAGDPFSTNPATASQDLAMDQPLIICTQGHAMVLGQLTYLLDAQGRTEVLSADVMDPWPYNPRFRSLSAQEWFGAVMCARVRVLG